MSLRWPPIRWILWVLLAVVLPQAGWSAVPATEPAGAKTIDPLQFRRIYILADRMKDWLPGNVKYLPIDRAEFERLLAVARTKTSDARASAAARLVTAEYRARLVGDRLAAGQATLEVIHAAEARVSLPLDPCRLAIGKARWATAPPGADQPEAATLGLGVDGRLEVLVERSGRLEFDWSLAGRRDVAGAVGFQIQLPSCPTNRLILDVPEDITPVADQGIVTASGPAGEGFRRWHFELGGHHRIDLRMVPAGAGDQRPQSASVRESTEYHFSMRGVDVSSELKFEVHNEPLPEVTLTLDPELQLATAKYGNTSVPWSVTSERADSASRVVLTFPEPIRDTDGVLKLTAWAPLKTDVPWRLPRMVVEETFWQEGHGTLFVPTPLLLKQLEPIGCRQSGRGPLSAPRVGESARFQFFGPKATVEITLSRHEVPVQLLSGTKLVLGSREMTAQVRADFRTEDAPRFGLEAQVAPHWRIDSVETFPPEALDDWTSDQPGSGPRKLTIRLAKPLTATRPIRLLIAARRLQSPLGRKLGVGDLVPLDFDAPEQSKRLVAVDAVSPYQLKLTGTERLDRINPRSLDAAETQLFAKLPRGLLFNNDAGAEELQIELGAEKPSYAGTLRVEASVGAGTLRESYVIGCDPKSGRVERVVVHLSHRRDVPLRWTLGAEDDQQLSAEQLIDEQADADPAPEGETWVLTLRRPRSQPFEIRGTRQLKLSEQQPVCLASLPEAAGQQATLVIRLSGPETVRITNHGLTRIPTAAVSPDRYQTARATYRYDPSGDLARGAQQGVTISCCQAATPPAWAWNCELESRYAANGTGQHLASYRLQSSGSGRLRLSLPSQASLEDVRDVWVDENRVLWQRLADGRLAIDLPPGEKFPTVSVDFTTPKTRLGIVGSLRPPWPEADLPVLSQHWTVWLPPGYEAFNPDLRWQPSRAPQPGWNRRLFGPLGRAADQEPFNPLAAKHWSAAASDRSTRWAAQRKAKELLQAIGRVAAGSAAGAESGGLNWAELLMDPSLDALQPALLVDRHAMARTGITPQTPVRPGSGDRASALGVSLLQKADLSLLVHPDAVLLTSQTEAALIHAYLEPLQYQPLWRVLPGPLAEQLRQAAAGARRSALVPVETWRRQPARPRILWRVAPSAGCEPADSYGWTAYRLEASGRETSDRPPVRLKFVHRPTLRLLGSVTFLLMVALGWWKLGHQPVVLTSLVGIFGFLALVLPEAYVPVASGAVLAALFCLALRLIGRRNTARLSSPDPDRKCEPSGSVSAATRLGIALLVATTMSAPCAGAEGEQSAGKSPAAAPPVHRVFVPVDKEKQPTGEKCYVPQELYNQLHRRAAAAAAKPQGWMITAATYQGVLSKETSPERLVVEQLKASFDLQVFDLIARVRIPFLREGAILLPEGALLDGRVIQPEWESDGGVLVFEVREPGEYRLELSLRPTMRPGGAPAGFDLSIPRLATSRLELRLPPGAPPIEVPSATGSILYRDQPPRLVAELGPSDRLTVRWPDGTGPGETAPTVDVEELLWLKVAPGSVVVDARFKFKLIEGQVPQLQLATDPRLRLDRVEADGQPVDKPRTAAGQPQIVTLPWPRPDAKTTVVDATFLLKGTSGVGNLRLPALKALGARPTRRWLAVWVDPTLKYESQPSERQEAVAVPDFLGAWGAAPTQPSFAYRLGPDPTDWSMRTWPGEPQTTVEQTLALSFDRDGTEVHFDAELETTAGYNFQYRLTAPARLQLKHVSVLEEGVERVARWSRVDNGPITVFLNGPVDGRQQLSLRGRLPSSRKRKRMPLPVVHIAGSSLRSWEIQLFRHPAVLVQVGRADALGPLEQPVVEPGKADLGRLVGRFRAEGEMPIGPLPMLTLETNRPNVDADQVTRLHCRGSSWTVEVDYRIHVSEGVVDEFRIEAAEPFDISQAEVSPSATLKVDPETRQLIVRPAAAIDAEYQFRVSGPLALEPGDRPGLPQIDLKQPGQVKRLVVLPRDLQGRAVGWETRNLKAAKLPDGFDALPPGASFAVLEVVGEPYQAILRPSDIRTTAHVHLADVHLAWNADGTCYGAATFDLDPGKSSECPLWLPAGYRLVQVSVAGVPITPRSIRPNQWQVPLGPERLPQRIEVVFTGIPSEPPGAAEQRFDAPRLGKLSVGKTLWAVVGPSMLEPGEPEDADAIHPRDQELIRLDNAAARIESASMVSAEDPEETFRWYWRWARRLAAARTALRHQSAWEGLSRQQRTRIRAIDQQQSQIAARLGMSNVWGQFSAGPSVADDPAELWQWSLDRRRAATRCAFSQGVSSIALRYRRAGIGGMQAALLSATVLVVLIALGVLSLRRRTLPELFKRWPGVFGVAVGLAWWLWLSPSILGWGIVLVSLMASLFSGWKRVAPAPGSSIISFRSVPR